eukprot:CAMPEP_0115015212 /NCGR_PEP_ID=MMETSP0216-20121206/26607_1 /TAXON_ID=223996 /ORGANISM="Protocruzia adherens, Strain Boccale" /LENGTH=612 /DNA_ID=CAMNT_0002385235 /DNA_START=118 /DNA_END=1953 /DNA_ORIENTATION=+
MDVKERIAKMKAESARRLEEKKKKLQAMGRREPTTTATKPRNDDIGDLLNDVLSSETPAVEETKVEETKPTPQETSTTTESSKTEDQATPVVRKAPVNLSVQTEVTSEGFAGKVRREMYAKVVQCDLGDTDPVKSDSDDEDSRENVLRRSSTTRRHEVATKDEIQHSTATSETTNAETDTKKEVVPVEVKKELTEQEVKDTLDSADFHEFFSSTSRIIERALGQHFDVMENFICDEDDGDKATQSKEKLVCQFKFNDDQQCPGRAITAIEWSPRHPELLLAAYNKKKAKKTSNLVELRDASDPHGMVCLWSTAMRNRPEYTFTSQSSVTAACFHTFQGNLVIGGTYSGQIVLWDLRARNIPVQRTALSSNGHSHPVYSLALVGSQNAHNIVSVSNDGRLCVWSMGMLQQPHKTLDLKKEKKDISGHCITFPEGETNIFFVGSEEGAIHKSQIHGSKASQGMETISETYEGHFGPVTSLHCHPTTEGHQVYESNNLMLSSSFDWTVKLWNTKEVSKPILSFDSYDDYVYDVQWSPVHPSVFATSDGDGYVDIWDLNKDIESSRIRHRTGERAVNKLRWSTDGRQLALGDSNGGLSIWNVDKDFYTTKSEDWSK